MNFSKIKSLRQPAYLPATLTFLALVALLFIDCDSLRKHLKVVGVVVVVVVVVVVFAAAAVVVVVVVVDVVVDY